MSLYLGTSKKFLAGGIPIVGGTSTLDATAAPADLLSGKIAYSSDGKITGTMPNNGDISATFDGINMKRVTIEAGYTSGGTIGLDDTIDDEVAVQADLIAQIQQTLENKLQEAS